MSLENTSKLALTRHLRELYSRGENLTAFLRSANKSKRNSLLDVMLSYDFQAGSYIAAYEREPTYLERYTAAIADILRRLGSFQSILEAGVGEATTLSLLSTRLSKEIRWMGFDVSWSRVKLGQQFAAKYFGPERSPKLFCADLFNIPLTDKSIDIVYTSHSIEPNGGREKEAIAELARAARKWLVLLEPAYDLASSDARKRMRSHGYVRNLASTIRSLGYELAAHRLFDVSANPRNPTGLYLVRLPKPCGCRGRIAFRCPVTGEDLEEGTHAFFSETAGLAYPVLDGVPCLTASNAILATRYQPKREEEYLTKGMGSAFASRRSSKRRSP